MITDDVFGTLDDTFIEDGYYCGKTVLGCGKEEAEADFIIYTEDDSIAEYQRMAYQVFVEKWPLLREGMLRSLLEYYNNEERFSYGPEDDEEMKAWWPEINTPDEMARALTLDSVIIGQDPDEEDRHIVYVLFGRSWGGEDTDDNGVAVQFVNEEIVRVGYKEIAF